MFILIEDIENWDRYIEYSSNAQEVTHTKYTISKNTSFSSMVFCMFGIDTCLIIFPKIL